MTKFQPARSEYRAIRYRSALAILAALTAPQLFLPEKHASPAEWPDPVAHDVMPYHTSGLTHGPMLGKPLPTSMRVWVRIAEPVPFRIVYATQKPLTLETASVSGQDHRRARPSPGKTTPGKTTPASSKWVLEDDAPVETLVAALLERITCGCAPAGAN
jgi:hypothetical protein